MTIETRTSRLVKKTGVEKSRWTVPLIYLSNMSALRLNQILSFLNGPEVIENQKDQ
jgi:hypothetical protein